MLYREIHLSDFEDISRISDLIANVRYNTVVSNHSHSVKILLFSSARSRDFDGLIGIELPVLMYTTKTPIVHINKNGNHISHANADSN
jgi:hypothetical protein